VRALSMGVGALVAAGALVGGVGCRQVLGLQGYSRANESGSAGEASSDVCETCLPVECVEFASSHFTNWQSGTDRPALPTATDSEQNGPPTAPAATPEEPLKNPCNALPSPVYVSGSSAAKPFLKRFGENLFATGEMTIVYQSAGSCVGVDAVVNHTPVTGSAKYWDDTGAEATCDLPVDGQPVDLAISDVFASTCPQFNLVADLPADLSDEAGPVQTMGFVVPASSNETVISADAAYFVYGFGSDSGVEPWTDESAILQRNSLSGTQSLIGKVIGVPPALFHGAKNQASSDMVDALKTLGHDKALAQRGLGILNAADADQQRAQISWLPFQEVGQDCGYYPDASRTGGEKQNVRDGKYPIWGPLHLLSRQATGTTERLVSYLTGNASITGLDLVQVYVEAKVIPRCAMRVTRDTDGGRLRPYHPDNPCGCYFESQATGTTRCKACQSLDQCPETASTCSNGFCEE
jgi:hypothetical protein